MNLHENKERTRTAAPDGSCRADARVLSQRVDAHTLVAAGEAAEDGVGVGTSHLTDWASTYQHDPDGLFGGDVELVEAIFRELRGSAPAVTLQLVAHDGVKGASRDLLVEDVSELVASRVGELGPEAAGDQSREARVVEAFRVDREDDVFVMRLQDVATNGVDEHRKLL